MKVSIHWIREINRKYQSSADPMPAGIDALVEKIGAQLGAVEEVIDVGKKYKGVVVAKVIKCQKHPNADKLSICMVDDGGVIKNVKRDSEGLVQVVCGAPNVAAGQLVAWIPPGVTVPSTIDKEPLVLEAREIRGEISHGMIASAKELAFGDEHEGILVLAHEKHGERRKENGVKPGTPLTEALGLDDYIVEIENKMFTHRPDLFGQLGIARELAGIQGHVFKSPSWYQENPALPKPSGPPTHKLTVKNDLPDLVPRFVAVVMKDIKVGPSPLWLRVRLNSVGVKSINNIVDITNYLMYETAQPLHAYDYDKLIARQPVVASRQSPVASLETRLTKAGEELTVLGGKKIKLKKDDIVIASGGKAIGLGGVMGGTDTEVDQNTKNIVLEVANFDMNSIRRTAMTYGLFTEAATRFTKNQSPRQNLAVLVKAIEEIKHLAGGRQASQVVDDNQSTVTHSTSSGQESQKPRAVQVSAGFINQRLGLDLSTAQIKKLLENVEFEVSSIDTRDSLLISVPFWRTDIEIPEDIVEEVGRLYGYDHLPLELPARNLTPAAKNESLEFKQRARGILSAAGANEVLTYSFIHSSLIDRAGQDAKDAYHIRNALSPDLQYYRLSLTPSLLEKIHPNIKERFDNFVLFEFGIAHLKNVLDKEKLPQELQRLCLVVAKNKGLKEAGAPYFAAKTQLENLLRQIGIHGLRYDPIDRKLNRQWIVTAQAYEPKRSAAVYYKNEVIGLVGEPTQRLKQTLKLPEYTAQAEVDISALLKHAKPPEYYPLNRFPSVEQDLCLRTKMDISYSQLTNLVLKTLGKLSKGPGYRHWLQALDLYQRPGDKKHKQTTWHIVIAHPDRTLTTGEVNRLLDRVAAAAKVKFAAERV